MSDDDAQVIWEDMKKLFGHIAHPDIEPKRFASQVKLYKHIQKQKNA